MSNGDLRLSETQRKTLRTIGAQKQPSPYAVATYRDTFRLLHDHATRQLGGQPTDLSMTDIDAKLLAGFVSSVAVTRKNGILTRNVREFAIRDSPAFSPSTGPRTRWIVIGFSPFQ